MTQEEKEYVLWLSNRLVNKYREDSKIHKNIETILDKNQRELDFYKKAYEAFDKLLSASIFNYTEFKESNKIAIRNLNTEYFEHRKQATNDMLENIDFGNLFRLD